MNILKINDKKLPIPNQTAKRIIRMRNKKLLIINQRLDMKRILQMRNQKLPMISQKLEMKRVMFKMRNQKVPMVKKVNFQMKN